MFNALKISAVLLISTASMSQATTVVNFETLGGLAQETVNGIRADSSTRGNDLDGMHVTATYQDGTSEDVTWAAYDAWTYGGVTGENLLFEAGWDGFHLTTTRVLTGLTMRAGAVGSLFDVSTEYGTENDTPTTGRGFTLSFADTALLDGTVTATYSGIVNLAGETARGDLYTDLHIDFSQVAAGGLFGAVQFYTDLDTLADLSDLTPSVVPLPASLPLMLVGLGGIGLMRRKKRS